MSWLFIIGFENMLRTESEDQWIDFVKKEDIDKKWECFRVNKENINEHLYEYLPDDWKQFDVILCKPITVSGVKKSKSLKRF